MKKTIILIACLCCVVVGSSAQNELQRLLTTYTESVRVPFYKECKEERDRVPRSVNSVSLDGDVLTIVCVVHIYEYDMYSNNNTYNVRIELSKTTLSVRNTTIYLTCPDGIEIVELNGESGKKYPFLVEKWSIKCNDTPLLNRLLAAFKGLGKLKAGDCTIGNTASGEIEE